LCAQLVHVLLLVVQSCSKINLKKIKNKRKLFLGGNKKETPARVLKLKNELLPKQSTAPIKNGIHKVAFINDKRKHKNKIMQAL
jgi:hypothetical protein